MALVIGTPATVVRARPRRLGAALLLASGLHAFLLVAVLLAHPAVLAPDRPPVEVALAPLAPPPFLPPRPAPKGRAGGSPAAAPRRARAAAPTPRSATLPPPRIEPPAPVPVLPAPAPAILAPRAPELASPVTGAGAGAATGGSGAGLGAGPGGPGGGGMVEPRWIASPGPEIVERFYPLAAYAAQRAGAVELACLELADGRVRACRVVSETPPGEGFGRAALQLSRWFRLAPVRVDGAAVEARVRIPYEFDVGGD